MGKGGGNTTSTGTTYTTNIPEYAKPYVETMLGATQRQLFEGTDTGDGGYNITGFKPYKPYSTNPADYIAGFSPLQQQAQQTVGGMQVPGQFQTASDITGQGIMGAAGVGQQAGNLYGMGNLAAGAGQQYAQQATNPYAMSAYMSPYMQNVTQAQQLEAIRQSDIMRQANQAQATQAGAFGGSRQAIVEAERQRNLGTQLSGIQAQGLQNAFQNAQQAQQFGSTLGLQGLQAGAGMYGQGVGAQQAAINQMMQGAGQYAGLGAQQLQAQQGIANLQNQFGAQQQSQQQQQINQAIQDYANAQQYPLMQLGVMSNMLRGLPMQAATTQQYVAAPNAITQGIGTAGAAASIYNATKAEGGIIKSMAKGGITSVPSYDVGGEVESQLESMGPEELEKQAKESSSPTIRRMAAKLLRERQMAQAPQGVGPTGPMGVQYQAPQMAGGGIIAFAKPEEENNYSLVEEKSKKAEYDPENPAGGILGNASTPLAKKAPMTADRAIPTTQDYSYLGSPYLAEMYKQKEKYDREANRSVEELAAEKEAAMGPDLAAQEYRKQIMDERASAKDEAQRQRWLRAAQFFAKWGSTPGPVLVAGMNALNEKLPDIITDEQTYKKVKRDIDKSIFELDRATRLEKAGYKKEAREDIAKARDIAVRSWHDITNFMGRMEETREQSRSALERTKMDVGARSADRQLQAARLDFEKASAANAVAQHRLEQAYSDIEKAKAADKPYEKARQTINEFNGLMESHKDDKNYKPHPQVIANAKAAEKLVQDRDSAYAEKLRIVKAEADRASKRLDYTDNPRDKGKEKEKGKNQPTVSNWN